MSSEPAQSVLVTGSSAGIGRAIAQHLLLTGWSVLGMDRSDATLSDPSYRHVQADLTDAAVIKKALDGESLTAFVHAAGVLRVGKAGELDLSAGDQMWAIHNQAAAVLTNALVPSMVQRRQGRIVYVGSRVSQGMPGRGQYAATKAGLVAMARSWAAELAPFGVTLNVVSPAATSTSMLSDPQRASSQPKLPPIGRLIQPEEVAALVGYLLSPSGAAITGQEITICGGSSLHS